MISTEYESPSFHECKTSANINQPMANESEKSDTNVHIVFVGDTCEPHSDGGVSFARMKERLDSHDLMLVTLQGALRDPALVAAMMKGPDITEIIKERAMEEYVPAPTPINHKKEESWRRPGKQRAPKLR